MTIHYGTVTEALGGLVAYCNRFPPKKQEKVTLYKNLEIKQFHFYKSAELASELKIFSVCRLIGKESEWQMHGAYVFS